MITKAAKIVNSATRDRWSTVILLALIFTVMRIAAEWNLLATDGVLFAAKVFATLIIGAVLSFAIHVLLYLIFSPKPIDVQEVFEKPVDTPYLQDSEGAKAIQKTVSVKRKPSKVVKKKSKKR